MKKINKSYMNKYSNFMIDGIEFLKNFKASFWILMEKLKLNWTETSF